MAALPASYEALPYREIRVSHVPTSSPNPTPVILVTLYRPAKHNAFTDVMMEELIEVFDYLSKDDRVKVIVVTGHGKMFCAGADLEIGLDINPGGTIRTSRDGGGQLALAILRCTKPIIAAINGSAVGVGITSTLSMDIRIVSNKAKIGFVFARRGIVTEAASSYLLPRLIGLSRALHLTTTGAVYPSTSPFFGDLFSEIVNPAQVLPRALELADDIAKNCSVVSVRLMKDMMLRGKDTPEGAHLLESKVLFDLYRSKDKKEGMDSFLEKRQANFQDTMEKDSPAVWPWFEPLDTSPSADSGRSTVKPKL